MHQIKRLFERIFPTAKPLPAGIYHMEIAGDAATAYRLHLRLEANGEGILIINASTVLHLNPTAAEFAYYFVQGMTDQQGAMQIALRYKVEPEKAYDDFKEFKAKLDSLMRTPDLDPVTFLDFERRELYETNLTAPYRLDCALTYRLSDAEPDNMAPVERVKRELSSDEWFTILDKAWGAGIPHIIFTGGEPTLRPDLPDLILHAEKLGQVTGLITSGTHLAQTTYLHKLLMNGLDHLMITLDPENDASWEAVRDVLVEDIAVTIHLTLTEPMMPEIIPLLDYLARLGAKQLSLSTGDMAMKDAIQATRTLAIERGFKIVWDLPVPYSEFHPIAFELAMANIEPPVGAGKAWLYVEPDGDVLPGQGINEVLGNLLTDPWEKIWSSRK